MPYAYHAVHKVCRRSRRTLAVCAEGLTMDAARALASSLRDGDRENEASWGYAVSTMPLARQADLCAAAGAMAHAADPAPYRLAA